MSRRFIFRRSMDSRAPASAAAHSSGFGITASEGAAKQPAEKMAETSQADIHDAREWLKRQGLVDTVAMFDASVK